MISSVRFVFVLVFASILVDQGLQCMPGNGHHGRRRPHRKHGRLLYKQRVPDLSETSLGSSGESEGPIGRNDERFKELVANGNQDIVFKESVKNVRIMSQRCKDRLNSLSILVLNTWPGVKLRVVKAWDETQEPHHSRALIRSLHQDGRAVDITTSDRDREKLGILAGLAVDAGFDWIFYESRSHIHCSVKPDSYITSKIGGCFPSREFVHLENGTSLQMSQLSVGDSVLTMRSDGKPVFDRVIAFLHSDPSETTQFVTLRTTDSSISLTPDHLVFTGNTPDPEDARTRHAGDVQVGEFLYEFRSTTGGFVPRQVVNVSYTVDRGVYAPLTAQGTIVVGGHAASCYGLLGSHRLAHAAFLPIRLAHQFFSINYWQRTGNDDFTDGDGIHWYAALLHRVFYRLLPAEFWYRK